MARITDLRIRQVTRPLRTAFTTALGQKRRLTSVLATVVLDDRSSGTGEVPTSIAFRHETVEKIGRVLVEARRRLKGLSIDDWEEWAKEFRKEHADTSMSASGLEVALFRAFLSQRGIPEHAYWGGSANRLETDITIPLLTDPEALASWIGAAADKGFTVYKLKVGGGRRQDEKLLSLVYGALQARVPGFRLRLDGNQAYSVDSFRHILSHVEKKRLRRGGLRTAPSEGRLQRV
jgi:L-Ala-D/L-Glu epimerase